MMDIGDEILIRAKIVDFDANPHGASVKVSVQGFMDKATLNELNSRNPCIPTGDRPLFFWIHRVDKERVIVR